jgi:GNAT superfamily N-acetyltransferase
VSIGQDSPLDITICRWSELRDRSRLVPEIDAIFFEASATKSFASAAERAAFRDRWLGRYLEHYPEYFYLALDQDGAVAGYLAGSLDDPARTPIFSDISYFRHFADLTAKYPAQLHVNVAPRRRGQGTGGRLVAAFVADAGRAGARGVHVVAARGMRNVGFYLAKGFREAGSLDADGRELVFLARDVAR